MCLNPKEKRKTNFLLMLSWVTPWRFFGMNFIISISLPNLKHFMVEYTLCVRSPFTIQTWWQFRVCSRVVFISILWGLRCGKVNRREYIMNVRAHMSCRRWFQYHGVTVLRSFSCDCANFLFSLLSLPLSPSLLDSKFMATI